MDLRTAVGVSVAAHLVLISMTPPAHTFSTRVMNRLNKSEFTYLPVEVSGPRTERLADAPLAIPQRGIAHSGDRPLSAQPEAHGATVPERPPDGALAIHSARGQQIPIQIAELVLAPEPEVPRRVEVVAQSAPAPIISNDSILPEEDLAKFDHKQRVRQKLKTKLIYPANWMEGTVRLRLVLEPSGLLKEAQVLESSDPELAQAALDGAQASSPFPRFPKEMKEASAEYDFLVQYRMD